MQSWASGMGHFRALLHKGPVANVFLRRSVYAEARFSKQHCCAATLNIADSLVSLATKWCVELVLCGAAGCLVAGCLGCIEVAPLGCAFPPCRSSTTACPLQTAQVTVRAVVFQLLRFFISLDGVNVHRMRPLNN